MPRPVILPSPRLHRTLLPAALAALALGACVDNNADTGLTILRNIAPTTDCEVSPSSTTFRSAGRIQVDSRFGYLFTPVIRNDLTLATNEPASSKTIFVEGVRVTIEYHDAEFFNDAEQAQLATDGISRFTTPVSGSIAPDGGLITLFMEVVPTEMLAAIAAKLPDPSAGDPSPSTLLDVRVQVFGTQGGSAIESNQFRYPIEVCSNCIVFVTDFPCAQLPMGFVGRSGGACNPLQDGTLDCCVDAVGGLTCPATPPSGPET